MVGFLKALRGFLILGALILAVIPPAILVDLLTGGTGYGLCEGGLNECDAAYMTGPTLAGRIFLGLLVVTLCIRLVSRLVDRIERRRRWADVFAYYGDSREGGEGLR